MNQNSIGTPQHRLAAIYARVSTLQQEQEATIDSQVAELEKYAQEKGLRLSREFYFLDQAVSGAQLPRPALDRLRDLAIEGLFDTVLCFSPDRLSRKYAHQWILIEELKRLGVSVIFVNQPPVEDNPQGQLLLGIQGLFSEYERAVLAERLRRGKLYRIRRGDLVNPVAPYGYRYIRVSEPNGGRWEEHPIEAAVVRHIFHEYTEKDGRILQIVGFLNENIASMPPRGKHWYPGIVQTILSQPAYMGKTHYNRTRTCYEVIGKPRKIGRGAKRYAAHLPRPKEEWIPMSVPPLVSEEMWLKAQERLKTNFKFSPRNNKKHFFLLGHLLVCGVCGRTLTARERGGHIYYSCIREKRSQSEFPLHTCSVNSEVIEPLVWQAVVDLLKNPTLLTDAWESEIQTNPNAPDEPNRLQSRLKALETQWQRLLDLFQEEKIDKAELSKRKARIDQERASIQTRLEQFDRLAQQKQIKQAIVDDFETFCQKVNASMENPTPQLQQEVIRLLVDHVVVGKDEIVIKHIVPADDNGRLLPGRKSV